MANLSSPGPLTHGFLFADLRGYTAYLERHGDAAGADLIDRYRSLVRDVIGRVGGAEIKTEGDSFYIVFPSASQAVAAGLAIVAAAGDATRAEPRHPISVGVGIHAGEAEARPDGYVGTAVNIAARVCSIAQPGEVLVTDMVRGLIRGGGRYRFSPRGRRSLKGVSEPIAVFRAELGDETATHGAISSHQRPLARNRGPVVAGILGVVALVVLLVRAVQVGALVPGGIAAPPTGGGPGAGGTPSSAPPIATAPASPPPLRGGRNEVGTYCSATFTPSLCLTLPTAWTVIGELANEIVLTNEPYETGGQTTMVNPAELGNRQGIITISRPVAFRVPCSEDRQVEKEGRTAIEPETTVVGPTSKEFIEQLRANRELVVSDPLPVLMGRVETLAMWVTPSHACTSAGAIVYFDLFQTMFEDGYIYRGFTATPRSASRLFVLTETDDTTVIAVSAPAQRLEAFLQAATALLTSLRFAE